MKKLLLIIVDAIASPVVVPALAEGKLPNLKALSEAGSLQPQSIAVFPSITPAATSSIVTGRYPHHHGILGYYWYDLEHDTVVYYGDDFWVIWREGFSKFFDDFLDKLNHQRLRSETLFQTIERSGLRAANLNYLIFRGDVKHKAHVPFLLSLLPGIPGSKELYGPSILYFGDLVETHVNASKASVGQNGGIFHRFGFDDQNTAALLIQLAKDRALPDFTLAYFPDNDYRSHEVGPGAAITALENVDEKLGFLFEVYGGLEAFLNEFCLVLTGDHSQTDMIDNEDAAGIELDQILADLDIADAGMPMSDTDQIVLCPDMRSAQIYFQQITAQGLDYTVTQLLNDPRIDQVIWRAEKVGQSEKGYRVITRDRGQLHFWPGRDGPYTARDRYDCDWSWDGDLSTVDGQLFADNVLSFPDYPNAFERIVGGLNCSNSGHVWVTAQPGYEFQVPDMSIHLGGGSHGSLHVLDSVSPLFLAGAPAGIKLPPYPRAVDINPLCLTILDLKPPYPAGASRISQADI